MVSLLGMKRHFRHLFSNPTRQSSRRRFRPELLCLEDRVVPSLLAEVELNNTTAAANAVSMPTGDVLTTAPADWLAINGSISGGADVDYYRFTLDSRAGVFFDVD